MAWTSAHFAVGMMGGGALGAAVCLWRGRGWRLLPIGMTLGGLYALVPDLPRLWREDFPWWPFAATLGDPKLERWLHSFGDVFFFHASLDAQPHQYALHGLFGIIFLFNAAVVWGMWMERRRARREPTHTFVLEKRRGWNTTRKSSEQSAAEAA